MYIQNLVRSLAIFCMVLMICLPVSMAAEIEVPELVSPILPEREFFEGEYADFALNVKSYDPRPLVSSTIEKGNAPVYVHLDAIPTTLMGVPRIRSISVREVGTHVLAGGIRYVRPTLYRWGPGGDFGYLIVRLKQIPKEDDVPDTIVANLTAKFTYESDVLPPGLIGGTANPELGKIEEEKLKMPVDGKVKRFSLDLVVEEGGDKFFGGYIVAVDIGKDRAKFIVFNEAGRPSYTGYVSEGMESRLIPLVPGSKRPEDFVRVVVDKVTPKESVVITLLAGMKTGKSEVGFKLIIPVDKRPFDLTTEEIKKHMEWTNKTIEKLDGAIENLNVVVKYFYAACIISYGVAVVASFFGAGPTPTPKATGKVILDVTGMAGGSGSVTEGKQSATTGEVATAGTVKTEGELPSEMGHIYIDPTGKTTIFPIHDITSLPASFREVQRWDKERQADDGGKPLNWYAVHSDEGLKLYTIEGTKIDAGSSKIDGNADTVQWSYGKGDQHNTFTKQKGVLQGVTPGTKVNLFGQEMIYGTLRDVASEALACEKIMSRAQCLLIYNFCDPVICPNFRCTWGSPGSPIQEQGLVASVIACLPTVRDGTIVPICLSGIRDSLEMIRSYIQGYQRCLEIKLKEGRSVGFCDRTRSIFMCELVWKHVLAPVFGTIGRAIMDGGYTTGLGGALQKSRSASRYFTDAYAKRIFAAYKGKITEEIGTELCRSAIVGKFPNFGKILIEIAEGGKPTQYTAQFEEHVYSKTTGQSRYFGYYHIYVGSSTETVNYAIYLKDCGVEGKARVPLGQSGTIKGPNYVDESFEQIGPSGCRHICLVINGENQCAFGKVLSSSKAVEYVTEGYVAKQAARNITSERDCVPDYGAYIAAAVNRKCQAIPPGEGWINVGECEEINVPCWAEISAQDIGQRIKIECVSQGYKKVCTENQICEGEEIPIIGSKKVCCKVKCKDKEEKPTEAPSVVAPSAPELRKVETFKFPDSSLVSSIKKGDLLKIHGETYTVKRDPEFDMTTRKILISFKERDLVISQNVNDGVSDIDGFVSGSFERPKS